MSDSISSLQQTLDDNPENWETRFRLIQSLHQADRTSEAIDLLAEVTALPVDDRSIIYAAQSYQVLGAKEHAQSIYETALELNPQNQAAKVGLRSLGITPPVNVPVLVVPTEDAPVLRAIPVLEDTPMVARAVLVEDVLQPNVTTPRNVDFQVAERIVPPPPVITKDDIIPYDPATADFIDHIVAAEQESKLRHQASISRDRLNAVLVTIVAHVALFLALGLVMREVARPVAPQIVASSAAETQSNRNIEKQVLKKSSLKATTPSDVSAADVLTVPSISAVSLTAADSFTGSSFSMDTGMAYQPSLSMGMPTTSSNSMMMFGQPLEGEVLGVVLDVSGSMAEFLPHVIREVDRNFKDAPIVYINNARIQEAQSPIEIRPIVKEEVVPRRPDGTWSPFWFLWEDLPRKAPERAVERLKETFMTRPNQFLAVSANGHWGTGDRLGAAMQFLANQHCDAVYVFSDFEDYIDEDIALEHGRKLAQSKVRVYVQPAVQESDFLSVMTRRISNRTKGRQLPALTSLINPEEIDPPPLVPPRPTGIVAMVPGTRYATPRKEILGGKNFYEFRPSSNWTEITRLEEPEFTAIFYGPEAKAAIFLKDKEGNYIQHPIIFGHHSLKYLPDHPDTAFRWRGRKFLRNESPPTFDGKEIVWKMVLEDELKFDVHLYLDRKGMNATYVAQPPADGTGDGAYIYFSISPLARVKSDRYFHYDMPEGISLDEVRQHVKANQLVLNLPRQERDRFKEAWMKLGLEPGYNTISFDTLITRYPGGVRDIKVSGPSFGPRIFNARTTSSKVLLYAGAWREDTEPWEGFHARLARPGDTRTKFTKTEAIAINIE